MVYGIFQISDFLKTFFDLKFEKCYVQESVQKSKGIHSSVGRIVYYILIPLLFELEPIACGKNVHAHVTYVLKSCCVSSSDL